MTRKMLMITPAQIKEIERRLAESDDLDEPGDVQSTGDSEGVLDHLPAIEAAVVRSVYGDAAAMDDAEFERFMVACGLHKPQQRH